MCRSSSGKSIENENKKNVKFIYRKCSWGKGILMAMTRRTVLN